MQYLYDETGRAYLDAYNNVPLVGHSHPRVVRAVQEQMALLNTNTRYLHDNLVRYAERLTRSDARAASRLLRPQLGQRGQRAGPAPGPGAHRPRGHHRPRVGLPRPHDRAHRHQPLQVRRARRPGTQAVGPCRAAPRRLPRALPARRPRGRDEVRRGRGRASPRRRRARGGLAAFIAETLPSVAGQIVLPRGYLAEAYRHVRAAGGVCIADEVQVGFGRLGTHFWGFETQGVVPDIVVLGKPIGNGFPLAAVVTTEAIAASFDNGMEFFSTFGGNPVACAAGLAVLDVMEEERLQERALAGRRSLHRGLEASGRTSPDHRRRPRLGPLPRASSSCATAGRSSPRPPRPPTSSTACASAASSPAPTAPSTTSSRSARRSCFSEADADLFVSTLDAILSEDPVRPGGTKTPEKERA